MRVFENKLLRGLFEPEMEEQTGKLKEVDSY
jgi:hypothetical protein